MAVEATVDKVLVELKNFGGQVIQTSLPEEDEANYDRCWKIRIVQKQHLIQRNFLRVNKD
jgi:uncharacterized membrane protein